MRRPNPCSGFVLRILGNQKETTMTGKFATLLGAAVLALASQLALSASASAACGPGYRPVKHSSGNIVCVLTAVPKGLGFKAR